MQLKEASILVVDDEDLLLDIMVDWFKGLAGEVFCAPDGAQALQALSAHRIQLVITDVRMPVMDGITLLKRIKARGSYTPSLIFITGFADVEARDAYDLGAEALLEKPIERDDLVKAARKSLSEPGERWEHEPRFADCPVLSRNFASLDAALRDREIAFGRGGFCIEGSGASAEGPVKVDLRFTADEYSLSGDGVVRWLATQDNQLGVELTYVAASSRARAVELTRNTSSFIPRNTGRKNLALAG